MNTGHSKNGVGEVDFLAEKGAEIVPIEVKSGKDYKRHTVLSNLMKAENSRISRAYVLCNDNVRMEGKITYLPIYMAGYLLLKH